MHFEDLNQDAKAADGLSGYILHPWTRFPPVIEPIMPLLATMTLMCILVPDVRSSSSPPLSSVHTMQLSLARCLGAAVLPLDESTSLISQGLAKGAMTRGKTPV